MLVGISSRYKQVVAYDFTGQSTNRPLLHNKIMEIVKMAWEIGLKCRASISDMGGSNSTLWKLFGIKATRRGTIRNFITHPCDPSLKFRIIADVPHLLKNIVQGLRNNDIITFSDKIVKDYDLSGNTVRCKDIFDLFELQQSDSLKLAPKLKSHTLNPNNFQKMNVPVSSNMIGPNVSTALYYMYTELKPKDKQDNTYLVTAWFCQIITKWFKMMTGRHYSFGISNENFEQTHMELTEMMDIMKQSKFGKDGKWKPFQRGFIVSTTSVLELSQFLLKERQFRYVLPGRLLQDCLENLFSVVRSGNPKRNALQVRDSIKQITVSEYLSPPVRNSSYNWDDSLFLQNFLEIVKSVKESKVELERKETKQNELDIVDLDISKVRIKSREKNVLYKIACYILYKISVSREKSHCNNCLSFCQLTDADESKSYSRLSRQPNLQYKFKSVFHIRHDLFIYFLQLEKYFRLMHPILSPKAKYNLGNYMSNKILDLALYTEIPTCHSLLKTVTLKFISFRLKNAGTPRDKKRLLDFSSKTIN